MLTLLAAVACSSPASEAPAATPWGEATVVEELSIGVDVGAEEYMFGSVGDIAVADDGTIFVHQFQPTVIRQYDAGGSFVRDIGRQGQGPGEYQYPAVEVLPDGRLAVWDVAANRLSLFSRDGEYEGSVTPDRSIGGTGTLELDSEGNFYIPSWGERTAALQVPPIELQKYSIDGERLDAIAAPERGPEGADFTLSQERIQPFTVATLWTWSPLGYLVVARNDRYDIELRKPSGTTHLILDRDPVVVGSEELAEWDAFRDRYLQLNSGRRIPIETGPVPAQKPFFRAIQAADDGRIWVFSYVAAVKHNDIEPLVDQPERPLLTWREPWTYDVFEPDGTFLGSVVVPELFRPFVFRGEHIWGALIDEEGVERVLRLRVVPEVR